MKIFCLSALLLVCCCTNSAKAQIGSNSFKPVIAKENLIALSFIETISFTPSGLLQSDIATYGPEINFNQLTAKSEIENTEFEAAAIENISSLQFKYAMMMDVDVENVTGSSIYNFIEEWFGTRYRMGGTTKKGIDCSAFTGTLLSSVYSFSVPRTAREQYASSQHLLKDELLTGDLVFFNTRGGVSHVGIYLTNGHFVHSSSSKGVTISSLNDSYYAKKYIGGGRINQ